ncbi:major capsid protein [Modestobacter sp. VKM Ac-2985]|uniref:major capsid protein n=1 Tax=Modestobacter sp. VKM Ac-2985 TaxID=3004139 RepID=UPI0022AB98BC|nr:major capsid protein [Modestobacter sp. VKM Ac-2985]MCZ2837144.1 major capsid protein [Modestobacter sp. VKM Ac-2985]
MQIVDLVPDLQAVILAAREQRDARNTLARFLPNVNVQDVSYRLGRSQRLDQVVPVRALDAPATPIRRPGVIDVRGDLPAVTPIEYLTEDDLTRARRLAGVSVDLAPSVAVAARRVALAVDNTFEQMRGQALSTGVVTLQLEDGNVRPVDFGVPDSQKFAAPVAWDAVGYDGDPFEELEAWHSVYGVAAGSDAGVMLTTRKVVSLLGLHLRRKYPQQPIGAATVAGELALRNLPPLVTYDRTLTTYEGTRQRVFPEGGLTFLPPEDVPIGRTELGVTQEAVQQVENRVLTAEQAAGLTIVTLGQDNPVQRAVKGAAIGLPVIQDTDVMVTVSGLAA